MNNNYYLERKTGQGVVGNVGSTQLVDITPAR
jgi:hypothetical protein